jgi:hypothetical protein
LFIMKKLMNILIFESNKLQKIYWYYIFENNHFYGYRSTTDSPSKHDTLLHLQTISI